MDLRSAKKGKDTVEGTVPNKAVTEEKVTHKIPAPDDNGVLDSPSDLMTESMVLSQYWDYLKKQGITQEDIKSILEAIIINGNVMWTFDLFNKIPVSFQIRPTWVDDIIIERIDRLTKDEEKVSNLRYNNLIAQHNLAASLVSYGNRKFSMKTEKDLDISLEFVKNMSYIVQNALVEKLAAFDRAVAVAVSDWSLRNFTTPRKEN